MLSPAVARPRIIVVDDHSLFAEGIRRILGESFNPVEVVGRASGVLAAMQTHRPEIVLLDISMPGANGIDTARQILHRYPGTKIIFLTMHTEPIYVRQALSTGAQGYVLKSSLVPELMKAIRAVQAGRIYISRSVEDEGDAMSGLSVKQMDVLKLLSQGRSAKEIATILDISVKTVEFHKTRIRKRLGIHSTAELTRFALENHL